MILFECNNVVILNFIIFYLNCNKHVNLHRYRTFYIPQHHIGLSTSFSQRETPPAMTFIRGGTPQLALEAIDRAALPAS
jgi:hypothetical protein